MKKIFINRIGRREFLKTSLSGLALATLPRISFAQSNPDVVVIGAGAAGLSATAELMKRGVSVLCIEGMNRKKVIKNDWIESKCGWTPFDGYEVKGFPLGTIVNGKAIVWDGKLIEKANGKPLKF